MQEGAGQGGGQGGPHPTSCHSPNLSCSTGTRTLGLQRWGYQQMPAVARREQRCCGGHTEEECASTSPCTAPWRPPFAAATAQSTERIQPHSPVLWWWTAVDWKGQFTPVTEGALHSPPPPVNRPRFAMRHGVDTHMHCSAQSLHGLHPSGAASCHVRQE